VDLPVIVEEGLAELVALGCVPSWAESLRWIRAARFDPPRWTLEEALQLTFETWIEMSGWEELEPRGLGFRIVEDLGLEGIGELREQARAQGLDHVPAEWFLGEGPGAAYPRLR
jgi:hypothetical protein